MRTTIDDTIHCRFFAPLGRALASAPSRRKCHEFPDEDFLEAGVGRVINDVRSGRDWVQRLQMWVNSRLSVSNFFKSLKSVRRLRLIEEVAEGVRCELEAAVAGTTADPLSAHSELEDFDIYASDGHYEAACSHADKIDGKAYAAGYFYAVSLRTHGLALLDIARPKRKREHDITALKRLGSTQLRLGAPKGRKVIHVYDPAAIDYAEWLKWKAKGVYVISREKENSKATKIGDIPWDHTDARNAGVLEDEYVGSFSGVLLRRVIYRDPVTSKVYSFMTTLMAVPPGLIAFLYKLRWDIEKIFDEKKNKLEEKKSWAKGPVSQSQQAGFICLAHNLLVLFERCLKIHEGICDEKVTSKQRKRLAEAEEIIRAKGLQPNPLVQNYARATERSMQFIRWIRHCLQIPTSWRDGTDALRPLMEKYIQ